MASDTPKFSHITVSADDEDDIVIHAGAREIAAESAQKTAAPVHEEEATEKAAPASQADAPAEESPASDSDTSDASEEKSTSRDKDYHATTLEDLEGSSMSTMQKVIFALAIVALAAFVVYYMVFTR